MIPLRPFQPRQRELLRLLRDPSLTSVEQMATRMGIGYETAKKYLSGIYSRLGDEGGNLRTATLWALRHPEEIGE